MSYSMRKKEFPLRDEKKCQSSKMSGAIVKEVLVGLLSLANLCAAASNAATAVNFMDFVRHMI